MKIHRRYIQILERRQEYLGHVLREAKGKNRDYSKHELAALTWALPHLKQAVEHESL